MAIDCQIQTESMCISQFYSHNYWMYSVFVTSQSIVGINAAINIEQITVCHCCWFNDLVMLWLLIKMLLSNQ